MLFCRIMFWQMHFTVRLNKRHSTWELGHFIKLYETFKPFVTSKNKNRHLSNTEDAWKIAWSGSEWLVFV